MSAAVDISRARDPHPQLGSALERQRYIVDLMAAKRWERGVTDQELADDWGMAFGSIQHASAEASRHLKLLGDREYILDRVRVAADTRLDAAKDGDFVGLSRLMLETVGALDQTVHVRHELIQRPEHELRAMAIAELLADDAAFAELATAIRDNPRRRGELLAGLGQLVLTEGEGR